MKEASTSTPLQQACPRWVEKLSAIHHDDLPFEERMELRRHLETCLRCQSVRTEYRALDALITDLPPVAPLAALPARLRELTTLPGGEALADEQPGKRAAFARLLADDTEEAFQAEKLQPPRQNRLRWRLVNLNMAAAVLVVAALVAGFLVLRGSHPGGLGSPHHSAQAHTPLQHAPYLNVIIGNGHGDSYAIDPQNGSVVWKDQVMSEPAAVFSANGIFYYAGANNILTAIDGSNGQRLWHVQLLAHGQAYSISWNIVATGEAIFVTAASNSNDVSLFALDAYTGNILWQKPLPRQSVGHWLLQAAANGVIYGSGDGLYAWSAQDGHQLWHNAQLPAPGVDTSSTSPAFVVAQGKLYFFPGPHYLSAGTGAPFTESHQIDVVDMNTGRLLNTISIDTQEPQPFGLVVGGNTLYAAMNDYNGTPTLQAYSLDDEHRLWQKGYNGRLVALGATTERVYVGLRVFTKKSSDATKNPADYLTSLIALQGNGAEVWRWKDQDAPAMVVSAIEINGVLCVVDGGVVGVRASDGQKLWRKNFDQATGFPPVVD